MHPFISVLIPTYKPDWYLERCLESLDKQSLSKEFFKIYIALNGPKDNYEDFIFSILNKYNFKYKYIYLEINGVSNARNKLLEISSEEYISFVDDDDVLSSNYLEELLLKISPNEIAISNIFNFSDSLEDLHENYIGKSFLKLNNHEISILKCRKFFSSPCAKLIHRKIIGSSRFNTKLKIGEDSVFMAEISKRVKGLRKTNSTACYYVYERVGSASRKKETRSEELKIIAYLIFIYSKMLYNGYSIPFILTRIAAALTRIKKIF